MEVGGFKVFYIDQSQVPQKIIDIVKNASFNRIALIVPSQQPVFSQKGYLKQIREVMIKKDKEIVFVNSDPEIIKIVNDADLFIYPDLQALDENVPVSCSAAAEEEDEVKGGGGKFWRLLTGLAFIITLVLAWVYFVYPTVTVEIFPEVEYIRENITVSGSLDMNKIDWDNNILPLHKFEVTITDEDVIRTSGERTTGTVSAAGKVKFINENEKEVKIPAGTIVATASDIEFKTMQDVIIPPLKKDYLMEVQVGTKAGQKEVEIKALKKGSSGNVATGEIDILKKDYEKIYVINPEPTTGGRDEKIAVITEKDYQRLNNNIEEKIKSKILSKVYQELGGNYRILSNRINYSNIEYNYQQQQGQASKELRGTGTLTAEGYLIRNSELDRLTTKVFKDKLKTEFSLLSSGINIEKLILEETGDELYNISIEVVAPVVPELKVSDIKKELAGNSLEKASSYLQSQENIADFSIKTSSANLPKMGFAIKTVISEPEVVKVFELED